MHLSSEPVPEFTVAIPINPHIPVMDDQTTDCFIPHSHLLTADALRHSLVLTVGQLMIAFLGAVLIANGLPT